MLLVLAGVAKLSRPAPGVADLFGFRAPIPLVRLVGGSEVAIGVAALLVGGPLAWAVGLIYASFAAIVLRAVLAEARSCGCFGRFDAPPSWVHIGGNLALAAVSFVAARAARPPAAAITEALVDSPVAGAALALEIVVVAGLALVAFTALPEALGARTARRGPAAGLFRAMPPPDHAVSPPAGVVLSPVARVVSPPAARVASLPAADVVSPADPSTGDAVAGSGSRR